jgi:hypothetical protein
MLYIKFNDRTVLDDPDIFDLIIEKKWFDDEFVREIIKDVDKSEVIENEIIESPVLGKITPRQLSGGVKMLILLYEYDDIIDATCCGENCAKWLYEISKKKDITVNLNYAMQFDCDVQAVLLYEGKEIHVNNKVECNMNIILIINDIMDKDLHPEARGEEFHEWRC